MFIDELKIKVNAGKGGDGCVSFRREKYVPRGGPDGGNGGSGSNIILKVDPNLTTLIDLRYQKLIKGQPGKNGQGKNKHGKGAPAITIKVPPGTVVLDADTNTLIADLIEPAQEVIVARGGRGGRGNKAFANATNTAPHYAENGEPGAERTLKLELKLIADVGLVGMPNVGKSTILAKVSAAQPKIANYSFTTLSPNLGVVSLNANESFVIADLPGLIEGAAQGEGLGIQFLRHIERTRVIAHVIDMSGIEERDPYQDYIKINNELKTYSKNLSLKPQIIIANKMDLPKAITNLESFKEKVKLPVYEICALKGEGLKEMTQALLKLLATIEKTPLHSKFDTESYLLYQLEQEKPWLIEKTNTGWLIKGAEIEKLLRMTNFNTAEGANRFAQKLRFLGIDAELKEKGAQTGDLVKILDFEFEYYE